MKRLTFSLLFLVMAVAAFGSWSWAVCPEAPYDNGLCDTLKVTCYNCTQPDTGAFYYIQFPMFITHDVPDPLVDSIAAMVIPMCYTKLTNPTQYCSLTTYWNRISWNPTNLPRSIFRHLPSNDNPQIHNWMMDLYDAGNEQEWDTFVLDLDGTSHFWLSMIPTGAPDQRVGDINNTLMVTMTMRVQDTMHVSIDTCFWPPSSQMAFSRIDSKTYVPRLNLPHTYWIGPPRLQVLSPNGGESWAQGSSHDITWLSENFEGGNVKIEYSTNHGVAWNPITPSTTNNGLFTWNPIPNTPSDSCLVRITNAADTIPHDVSDSLFSIIAPDFSIAVTPDTRTVVAGDSADYIVSLAALNDFSNSVTLSMSVMESSTGISSVFSDNPVTPPATPAMKVMTTGATVPSTYHLIVTGTYSSLVHKDTVTLIVTPAPNFTIDAIPDTQVVIVGDSVNYKVFLEALNGFSNPCSLKTSTLPGGVSAEFSVNPITPASPPDTSVMKIRTTPGVTQAGTYQITITATEQTKITKSTDVYLVVKIPDFTLDATPETLAVRQGEQGDYHVSLTALNGFSSSCSLSVAGLPADVNGVFKKTTLIPPDVDTLTITAGLSAEVKKDTLVITGTQISAKGTALVHSDTVILDVRSQKDFDLAVKPETLQVPLGETSSYKIKLTSISGFSSPCSLSVSGFPSEVQGSFVSPVIIPTDSTTLNVTASCNAQVSITPWMLIITAAEKNGSKAIEHSQQVWLKVTATTKDFVMAVQPDTQKVIVNDSTIYNITIHRHQCFILPCSLSVESGLPGGATYYFTPSIIPQSDSTSKLVIQSGTGPAGIYNPVIKGKQTMIPVKKTVSMIVQDFDVNSSPDSAIITQGQSAGFNITVTSLFGFAEHCTLMVSNLPNNSNGTFDKNTLIPTDNAFFNIFTQPDIVPGRYEITITAQRMMAKSTALEHSHIIVLKVNESSDVETGTDNPNAPKTFTLFQNQPNPFNPTTQISYYLPKACHAKLTVYNVLGQSVRVLFNGYQEAGMQNVTWDGKNSNGVDLSSGIYFYRLQAGDFNQTKKMSLMK
jgi:hypothetical protein